MKTRWFGMAVSLVAVFLVILTTCGLRERESKSEQKPGGDTVVHYYKAPPLPAELTFMGEPVPIGRFEVMESLDREMLVNAYFHSQTIRLIKSAPRFFAIIDPILAEEGVPADFRYLAVAESGLNPRAVSPAGAAGIWQFMRSAAADYGLEVNAEVDERYHIVKSTQAACRYLKEAYKKYGNWSLTAAAYNAGRASIDRQLTRQKASDYFDLLLAEETERYVFRIIALKLILEDPERYGFSIAVNEKYPLWETQQVEISSPVTDLADFAIANGISYKTLKYYNPWLRENFLSNKSGKRYIIEIPVGGNQ